MGKGDIKTKRGKITNRSYGKKRPKRSTTPYKAPIAVKVKEEPETKPAKKTVAKKTTAAKTKTTAKKETTKKTAVKKTATTKKKTTAKKKEEDKKE